MLDPIETGEYPLALILIWRDWDINRCRIESWEDKIAETLGPKTKG